MKRMRWMAALAQQQEPWQHQAVIVATAGDPRVAGYQAARARAGLTPAALLDYRDLIADPAGAAARISAPATVRIESPGRDAGVLAGLLMRGIDKSARLGLHHLGRQEIERQVGERGRLLPPRQLFFGLEDVLGALTRRVHESGIPRGIRLVPDVGAILLAFDKSACHRHLAANGVPVPAALGEIGSFDALRAAMQAARLPRVFVKLQHGSAAAGTVALATSKFGMQAVTTVEMVSTAVGVRLYNTRALRQYTSPAEVARLIDALAPHGLQVEAWIPKASVDGRIADLRVLVVAGEPVFRVLRKSRHPITNLHLGGERANADALLSRMPAKAVAALDTTCRAVARAFPGALQVGIDVAVAGGLARHYVLEVNAFGDLLKGVTTGEGLDAYDMQLRATECAA
jgi:glutathione synthase/RimK-type ligase-like ATP-grasp enzyme